MKRVLFKFRLYIAGDGPHSTQAMANLNALCLEFLPNQHAIEVVDVLCDEKRALADGVMLTPLLIKLSPPPIRKFFGTLRDREPVLDALGLPL